jgi:L-iditol 2-dehydrogenase
MKAFTYTGDRSLAVLDRQVPKARADTAVIRLLASAICGTDLRTFRYGSERIQVPRIIGHEGCGVIEEVGTKIENFRPGQRVVVVPAIGCGTCRWCKKGATNMCERLQTVGFDFDGTFAEFMEIPAQAFSMGNVLSLEDEVPTDQAVMAEPVACCVNGQDFLQLEEEDFVFIFGSGFIGCIHAELAIKKRVKQVVISDVSDDRLKTAAGLLPDVVTFNSASGDPIEFVDDLTNGKGADAIITACPSGEAHTTAMRMAATRARISLFGGIPGEGTGYLDSNRIHYGELSVFGSHASTVAQNRTVIERIAGGELNLAKYISATYPLTRIEDAFKALNNAHVLKVQIVPDEQQIRSEGAGE